MSHYYQLLLLCYLFKITVQYSKPWYGCLSHYEAGNLLLYKNDIIDSNKEIEITTSIDLNYSLTKVILNSNGLCKLDNTLLATWDEIESINNKKNHNKCYSIFDDGCKPWQISTISETTNNPASLCPPLDSSGAPTLVLGGFTMHRISGDYINPTVDTKNKLSSVKILPHYNVLDTCLGLGYTAIGAAKILSKGTGKLSTVEFDSASKEICMYNPWSQQLFDNTLPIDITMGDACDVVKSYSDNYFDVIIHDPPARALDKTNLYSKGFYQQLHRVINKNNNIAQLFHYIGNPNSKESGKLYSGIMSRLKEAGFNSVVSNNEAYGLVATIY